MTIQFGYEKKKVIQALRYHFISRPEIRIMIIIVNVLAIALLAAFAMQYLQPKHYLTFSLLWVLLMLSFWFIFPYATYNRTQMFREEYTMHFTEAGFTLEHTRMQRSWPWDALVYYLESPFYFHLYFGPRTFLLVPKDACEGDDEVHALRTLIKEHVKKGVRRS